MSAEKIESSTQETLLKQRYGDKIQTRDGIFMHGVGSALPDTNFQQTETQKSDEISDLEVFIAKLSRLNRSIEYQRGHLGRSYSPSVRLAFKISRTVIKYLTQLKESILANFHQSDGSQTATYRMIREYLIYTKHVASSDSKKPSLNVSHDCGLAPSTFSKLASFSETCLGDNPKLLCETLLEVVPQWGSPQQLQNLTSSLVSLTEISNSSEQLYLLCLCLKQPGFREVLVQNLALWTRLTQKLLNFCLQNPHSYQIEGLSCELLFLVEAFPFIQAPSGLSKSFCSWLLSCQLAHVTSQKLKKRIYDQLSHLVLTSCPKELERWATTIISAQEEGSCFDYSRLAIVLSFGPCSLTPVLLKAGLLSLTGKLIASNSHCSSTLLKALLSEKGPLSQISSQFHLSICLWLRDQLEQLPPTGYERLHSIYKQVSSIHPEIVYRFH